MSTPEQVIGRINKLPDTLARGKTAALKASAEKARSVMQAAPGAVHSVNHKPIGVRTKQVDVDTVSVKWGPAGWVRIVNDPTQPHYIARRTGRGKNSLGHLRGQNLTSAFGRKSARAGRLLLSNLAGQGATGLVRGAIGLPGIGPRAYAFHPGTKGKHFVEKGKRLALPVASQTYATKSLTEPMRSVFHG